MNTWGEAAVMAHEHTERVKDGRETMHAGTRLGRHLPKQGSICRRKLPTVLSNRVFKREKMRGRGKGKMLFYFLASQD